MYIVCIFLFETLAFDSDEISAVSKLNAIRAEDGATLCTQCWHTTTSGQTFLIYRYEINYPAPERLAMAVLLSFACSN